MSYGFYSGGCVLISKMKQGIRAGLLLVLVCLAVCVWFHGLVCGWLIACLGLGNIHYTGLRMSQAVEQHRLAPGGLRSSLTTWVVQTSRRRAEPYLVDPLHCCQKKTGKET
jgi:hypothetical protein